MPAPKHVERGQTVRCVRASVLLHPALHRAAKHAATDKGISLSDMIAALVAKETKWKKETT
jgi:predicted HicB family RNase H-like nuclease